MINLKDILLEVAATEGEGVADSGAETTQTDGTSTETTETQNTASNDIQIDSNVTKIEIDGEQYTLDELSEFRKGYMRQSDYTKKAQEVSRMRKETKDAIELYDYLRNNPQIAKRLSEVDDQSIAQHVDSVTADPAVQELSLKVQTMEIDRQLNDIKNRDKNIDEVAVLQLAIDNGTDVETAYNMWRGKNFDNLLKQELKNYTKNITEKIQENASSTATMINPGDSSAKTNHGLTDIELEMCKRLDMTPAEYSKYKTYKR